MSAAAPYYFKVNFSFYFLLKKTAECCPSECKYIVIDFKNNVTKQVINYLFRNVPSFYLFSSSASNFHVFILQEGVQSYSTGGNIPWRTILDRGRGVFDDSRNPVDLKDKWKTLRMK